MIVIIQERFPTFGAVITTSAPADEAMSVIGNAVLNVGDMAARTPSGCSFRLPLLLGTTPLITIRAVPSVAGTNVHVRVADEGIWRTLHLVMLIMVLVVAAWCAVFREILPSAIIITGALCMSIGAMWWIGHGATRLVREALPD